MTVAVGVAKKVAYKAESSWGVAPGTSGAQLLRRVSSTLNLKKQGYESNEIASHLQRLDFRHGMKSAEGQVSGEISPGTYKDFFAAICRKVMAATAAMSGFTMTIAGTGPTYTVTRSTGSWITDGVKAGDVTRITGGTFNAANLNKNLVVCAIGTTAALTVMPLNGVAMTAEGPITGGTMSVPGKRTYVPTTGHTDNSFAFEHYHQDLALSELFLGCKLNEMGIQLPTSGMATIDMGFMGKDLTTGTAQYYSSPTAETTAGILAAVNGVLVANGTGIATLTGMSLTIRGGMQGVPVIGSNTYADIAEGRVLVEGQVTALFTDSSLRDYFINETEVSLVGVLSSSAAGTADFVGFSVPRVKFGDASKDDGDKALIQTLPFTALLNVSGGTSAASEQTTLVIQDSLA